MVKLLKLRSGTSAETRELNATADFFGAGQAAAFLNGGEARSFGPAASVVPTGLIGQLNALAPESEKQVRGMADEGGPLFCPVGHYEKAFNGYEVARGRENPSSIFDGGTLTVTVGGSVSGVIDVTGDVDTITVSLTAGQTYLFSLVGSGGTPVTDTLLSIFAPGGVTPLREDDDGGNGTFSLITITAAATGTYTLTAESFPNEGDPGLGGWTLSVRQQGTDNVPNTIPSTVDAVVGGTTYGFLETGTDRDVYRVTLTEGGLYNFAVAGGHDYSTPGTVGLLELDTVITIYNAAGSVVASNDDIDAGAGSEDLSSLVSFFAEASGTYYVEIRSFNDPGGYVLDITETDLSDLNPLDAIDWGGIDNAVDNSDTLLIYFATAGQSFDGVTSLGWTAYEQQQALEAFQTYSQFADLNFAITTNSAVADFKLVTTTSTEFLGYFNPPGETNAGVGVFAINGSGWDRNGSTGGLEPGGYGWITLIHEFGHGLGLAHPHDNGGGSEVMPGVSGPFGSYGIFDLNQGVYTTMSYNDGWQLHPDADSSGFPVPDTLNYGYQGTPMALDIALMQLKYGAVSHNTGNNVYNLLNANVAGTFYQCIWDTGGTDAIEYVGTAACTIDLTAATIDYSPTGAGVLSWVDGIFGGFTIAAGVVIENATGGNGDDLLVGNGAANVLTGNGGNDSFVGRGGNDEVHGGSGTDTLVLAGDRADYTITAIAGGHQIVDNNAADGDDGTDTFYDGEFAEFADVTINLNDAPGNQAPTLADLASAITFNENLVSGGPQLLDGDVAFDDTDGNFDGGTLTVSGLLAEDIVGIRNEGSGAGQIGVSGANVTYGGIIIGTFTGGTGGTFTLTFNGSATSTAVDQAIENLTYANNSQDPTLNRTLTFNVVDSDGAGLAAPATMQVTVNAQNDAPSGANNSHTILQNGAHQYSVADFGFSDIDGDTFLEVIITSLPTNGQLQRDGVAVTAGQVVSVADIAAGLLDFVADPGESGTNYATWTFQVRDNGGTANGGQNTDQSANVMTINVTATNVAPAVDLDGATGGINASRSYTENGVGIAIGNAIAVTDADAGDQIEGAVIRLTDAVAGDVLAISGALPAGISAVITTPAGQIVVTLSGAASPANYATAIGQIRYSSTSDNPTAGGDTGRTITVTVNDGTATSAVATSTITITPVDDAPVAQPDAFTLNENATISGASLFSNNGSGADGDPDNPLIIGAVNGSAANVGNQIALASGALLTVNANGTLSYNPNGAFNSLPDFANSGASNTIAADSFTYTLAGGNTVTVTLTVRGVDSNDLLRGTAGNDTLAGGTGNDTYLIENAGDAIVELANQGEDLVASSVSYVLQAGASVESLSTRQDEGTGALNLTGNEIANSIFGNAGANILSGLGGNDQLVGYGGNDVLIGGAGADVLKGGLGNDIYRIDDSTDIIIEPAGEGDDTVAATSSYQLADGLSVETMSTTDQALTTAISLVGNELAQSIFGNAGHNLLNGGGGNDQLVGYEGNDILEGAAGFDVMRGNTGNDIYRVEDTLDQIYEFAGEGDDIIAASTSYTLGAGLSIETMTAYNQATTNVFNLAGNELGQSISGNDGANVLNGGLGIDLLRGYGGADIFSFTSALGAADADFIADFVSGTDRIALDNAVFTGLAEGNLGAEAFVIGAAAADADDRIVYNQATGQLFFDADGNGAGAAMLFATLNGAPALAASDFMII